MIPTSIQQKHVLMAAAWIDKNGVPSDRESKKYLVIINGRRYPPKLIVSKASFFANGSEWSHENFTGGEETNSFLRRLGFRIIDRASAPLTIEMRRTSSEVCERCGNSVAPDHVFCEKCGNKLTSASPTLSRRLAENRDDLEPTRREFPHGSDSLAANLPMDQVRRIARKRGASVEYLKSNDDVDSHNRALLWRSGGQIAMIAPEDDDLGIYNSILLSPAETLSLSMIPKDTLDDLIRQSMQGKTSFEIVRDDMILKSIVLFQIIIVNADSSVPAQLLVDGIAEVSSTSMILRKLIADYSDSFHKRRESEPKSDSPDRMYA